MSEAKRFEIPAQASTMNCRSCGASVVFVTTENGHKMPVDAVGAHRGESHFANCDDPKRFRKRDRVASKAAR